MNHLYKIAIDPKRSLEERWEAVHKMLSQKKSLTDDVSIILQRTSARRRRRIA